MEQNITRIVDEVATRMSTERDQMDTEFSEGMAESTSNLARNQQNMDIDDDVQIKLNKHLEWVENATMKSPKINKDIWNIIEAHNQTLKTMEDLSVLESRVDSLTEKVNNFVQNVMIVRSLPLKVMNMQKKLNRLEQNIKGKSF